MRFLHKPLISMKKGTIIKVTFDKPTKVKLMTAWNFDKYKKGRTHSYFGGHYDSSPIEMTIPSDGHYNCVIEQGSYNNPIQVTGEVVIAGMAKRKRKIEAAPEAGEPTTEVVEEQPTAEETATEETPESVAEEVSEDGEKPEE